MKKYAIKKILSIAVLAGFMCGGHVYSVSSTSTATISVPQVSTQYTLGYLFGLINTNNSANNSNFLVALNGIAPIPDSQAWSKIPNGSGSAALAGMTVAWIQKNKNAVVTLQTDQELITILKSNGRLLLGDANAYAKILLYFKYRLSSSGPVYRFYLNDPFPGLVRSVVSKVGGKTQRITVNPVQLILNKWNV